jgi:hypothetical protein
MRACYFTFTLALQEIIASFSFQAKVNLSAIKRIYSSLLWHFEQVRGCYEGFEGFSNSQT